MSSTSTAPASSANSPMLDPGERVRVHELLPADARPWARCTGTYQMVTPDGEQFDAVISPFTLATPNSLN